MVKNIQPIKMRYGIIGNSPLLNYAIDTAIQVAPTDVSVLITGESGTGKEVMPQIIHFKSVRKHNEYIAVNCGAIPEGTIDSELFGHEKGSFTGAHETRKGYFEVANKGTIFLDEVAELPISTQVRLLRVLETGEFMKVGSSKMQKTDVRIIAATNVDIIEAMKKGKFREDLYFRLNTVPIFMPPLRDRKEDIHLLFRKFASDFAEKYRMPVIKLTDDAVELLESFRWPGNIRQLKNVTEQISILEKNRLIDQEILIKYLPGYSQNNYPMVIQPVKFNDESEKQLLYNVLFDLKIDVKNLKDLVINILKNGSDKDEISESNKELINKIFNREDRVASHQSIVTQPSENFGSISLPVKTLPQSTQSNSPPTQEFVEASESLKLADKEKELIILALEKHNNKRKYAAKDLGISERTLYRKIKEYDIN
jgi:transcriptional regulator with PAS, ATPase and Fis domain